MTYFLSYILIRTISRYREYTADRGAALITGAPEHLMSALQKIAVADDADPAARPARGRVDERLLHHPDERQSAFGELFATHPPLEKRLANLERISRELGRRSTSR